MLLQMGKQYSIPKSLLQSGWFKMDSEKLTNTVNFFPNIE